MIPILLVSDDKRALTKYINSKIKKDGDIFFEIVPEGTKYSIGEVKEVIKQANIFNPMRRIYYFFDFANSSLEAQNAMLKILEEAPENVLFLLSATSVNSLIPTIVSRAKVISLGQRKVTKIKDDIQVELKSLIKKKELKEVNFSLFEAKTKDEAIAVVDQMISFFAELMRGQGSGTEGQIIKELIRERTFLQNNNLTPQLAIDHILIFIAKAYKMKLI